VTKLDGPSGRVHGPDERATVREALYMYTLGAADITGDEGRKGSLARGKLADLVVLGADPLDAPADRVREIDVLLTMAGGRTVYEASLSRPAREQRAAFRALAAGEDCCALGHHDLV
jgi:predicted amidohydrolase YtcJ